ncbi:MAG TPA: glycoside hydrolase family 2 TIM barrel-domain containing protein [Fimbriimonadaceae bacterium]
MTKFLTSEETEAQQIARVWMPAATPLMTRWAKDVSPGQARPSYPRPAAVRNQWKSLNGLWNIQFTEAQEETDILVPFVFESALSGIGRGKEIHEHLLYKRKFRIPKAWADKRILLHFGAVDWEAIVRVNGREVGRHRGGYSPFYFDISSFLVDGEQDLEVQVFDPAAYEPHAFGLLPKTQTAFQPMGKQLGSMGIWYTRSTGIWQTVWIEPVNDGYITSHHLEPSLETGQLRVSANLFGAAETVSVKVVRENVTVATGRADVVYAGDARDGQASLDLQIPNVAAWSPENPILYDVVITVKRGKQTTDSLKCYCGFRTISIVDGQIALNGKPYMLRGVLDQGYWPDGIYTAPTEEALIEDIIAAKKMGFNTLRKHAKVEEALWYSLCDRHGFLVAQDMPSSQDLSTDEARANFKNEWEEVVLYLRNHPCIALWVPFNENWGNPGEFQDQIADFTKAYDPSRLLIDASGWSQRSKTEVIDHHDYTNNLAQYSKVNSPIPQWVGEYGGIALPVEGHTWIKWWGYQSVKTPAKFLQKIKFLTRQMTENPGFSGFCFTQLTDVEQELNGLLTYDRIPKTPLESLKEIFGNCRGTF